MMMKTCRNNHVKGGCLFVAVALLLMGCSSLESSVFPEELKDIRFGMTEQKLKRKRPELSKEDCPDNITKLDLCLKEKESIAGIASITWGFLDGRLVYANFLPKEITAEKKLLEAQIKAIRGLGGFEGPSVFLEEAQAAMRAELRWKEDPITILASSTVVDFTSVSAALGSTMALGPLITFKYSIFDNTKVKPTSSGVSSSFELAVVSVDAVRAFCEQRANLVEAFRSKSLDEEHCKVLELLSDVEPAFCEALLEPVETGRTTREGRAILTERLRKRGYYPFTAFMVARIRKGLYEVARLEHSYWYGYTPTGERLLLKTVATEYTSKGRFTLWVKKLGKERIETKDGFYQTWDVVEEDDLGTAIKRVFDAPAGDRTSQAARELLIELASGGMKG